VQLDFHGIEAVGDVAATEELEIAAGGGMEGFFLALVDGFRRRDDVDRSAGFDLDEDENVAVTADEVDFTARDFVIAD
jgi:hypothetical protein